MGVVSGTIDHGGHEFSYQEQQLGKGGAGSRGIQIGVKGSKKGVQRYKFEPNPHNNPKYNKGQDKFYAEAAEGLAKIWVKSIKKEGAEGSFPRYGKAKLTIMGETYTLAQE